MAGRDAAYEEDEEADQYVEAYMWMLRAKDNGHKEAAHTLKRMAKHMSSEQLDKAKARASREASPKS